MVKVISYTTPNFKKYSLQLEKDCQKFDIDYLNYDVAMPSSFPELMKLKLRLIKKTLEKNKKVLFIDVESRIIKPFPTWWYDCNFLVAKKMNTLSLPAHAFINTGFIWVDQSRVDLIEKAIEIDNFIDSTKSIIEPAWCDNLISMTVLNNLSRVSITKLNYNRFAKGKYELVRGNWKDQNTIIQHPTDNAWNDNREFYNDSNSGIFTLINHMKNLTPGLLLNISNLMIENCDDIDKWKSIGASIHEKVDSRNSFCINNWVFDPKDSKFSPLEHFDIKRKIFNQTDYDFVKRYIKVAKKSESG